MNYFTTPQSFFLVPLNTCDEEFKKINHYLRILDKSGIDSIIRERYSKQCTKGRNSYNPYHLFSMIGYCFSKYRATIREMEEMCRYDIRVAVFCIENVAQKLNLDPSIVYMELTDKNNILGTYIIPNYDILHTQSKDYIVEDIIDVMREVGVFS